jgi:hypothetical protein
MSGTQHAATLGQINTAETAYLHIKAEGSLTWIG